MRAGIACTALAAVLCTNQAPAQPAVSPAESHILSAFTSRADPGVLAGDVRLGPALRGQLDGETDSRRIYAALTERTEGKPLRVNLLPPAEAARYASLVGELSDPLFVLEAGDMAFLMQYATREKDVTFVEQLSGPKVHAAPELPPEAPKPAPIVEVPLPAVPVPEKPKPALVKERPKPSPVAVQKPVPPPPAAVAKPQPVTKPRGECVIKPVMSDEDLLNCGARP
jgi:hypothetical protein